MNAAVSCGTTRYAGATTTRASLPGRAGAATRFWLIRRGNPAMTEDVLEQVVDDWLRRSGYFTRTNVRFKPEASEAGYSSKDHNQPSDIDVLAINPTLRGPRCVLAVSCKAMQSGFSPNRWLEAAATGRGYQGRTAGEAWKHLREMWDPAWAAAHQRVVSDLTGTSTFTWVLAVTRLDRGGVRDLDVWRNHPQVSTCLGAGVHLELLTFRDMWSELQREVTERIEPSHIGRLAQLLKAVDGDS